MDNLLSTVDIPQEKMAEQCINSQILTKNLSYWIQVMLAYLVCVVISYHVNIPSQSTEFQSWLQIFLPLPLAANGAAAVHIYYIFAGFFSAFSFERIYFDTKNSFRDFIKQFIFQFAKRYVQLRAVIIVNAVAYAPFIYWVFGNQGRDVYYYPVRTLDYWLDIMLPIFWPFRVQNKCNTSCSSWFNYVLMNIEFVFYCIYFINYFVRRISSLNTKYAVIFPLAIALIIGILLAINYLLYPIDDNLSDYYIYWAGVAVYFTRYLVITTKCGSKIISRIQKLKITHRHLFYIVNLLIWYLWLILPRAIGKFDISCNSLSIEMAPFIILFVFDTINFPDLNPLAQLFVDKLHDISMYLYIFHYQLLREITPVFLPQLSIHGYPGLPQILTCWIFTWMYVLMFGMLSIPLYIMCKPLEAIPQWIKDYKRNIVKDKQKFAKDFIISIGVIAITSGLVILNQLDVFGHEIGQEPVIVIINK